MSRLLGLVVLIWFIVNGQEASAERLSFRSYGAQDGLTNFGNVCASIAEPGYLLVCSEHGVFFYDGRVFHNLGITQGLPEGGFINDIALIPDGRIAVRYPDRMFVSRGPLSQSKSPFSLRFQPVELGEYRFFSNFIHQMVQTTDGLAVIAGSSTARVDLTSGSMPKLEPMIYDSAERQVLAGPEALFQVNKHLWETFKDGRICSADPAFVRCYSPSDGAGPQRWHDVVEGDDGRVLARSDDDVATIDPTSGSISIEHIPDQGGPYEGYKEVLGLYRTSSNELITQSAHGLIIRKPTGWSELGVRDGIPSGTISSIVTDQSGQVWLQVFGRGLFRGLNYGHWEELQQDDGLSIGSAWATIRADDSVWVATDAGLDQIQRHDGSLRVVRNGSDVSYTVVGGPDGTIWSGGGKHDVVVLDPATNGVVRLKLPLLNCAVANGRSRVWLGTAHGLYHVDVVPNQPLRPVLDATSDIIDMMSSDGSSGVWLIKQGQLWHAHADGRLVAVSGAWPKDEFKPYAIASAGDGHLWIGGAGGLYDLTMSGDQIASAAAIRPPLILDNAVVAVMVDRRGWVWVGTGQGLSVFDGRRWVSTDADMGLVWNDISEGGLFDDPDGSVWISTSLGVSHLLDPKWLFVDRPVRVAISQAMVGETPLAGNKLVYTDAPLSLQFGTLSFGSERSVVFRYKLSGVDENWAESMTGSVRYASIPPGRHVLTLVGYDTLSHVVSAPVTLIIKMAYPWWRTWWAYALYVLLGSIAVYGLLRVRDRALMDSRRKLEALVEERTRDMKIAQAELRYQATVDSLTGLLNRREVRQRVQERLDAADSAGETLIAMLDVDHFKRVNDQHGHLIGDELLCAIGVRVAAMLHDDECAGRFGGEEFILVLGDRDGRGAERILVLHQMIRQHPFHFADISVTITCSIGLAWAGPGDDWNSLVGRADAALYEAKGSGRDRVIESAGDQALISPAGPPGHV